MIRLDIPGRGMIELHHAVFDVNGTLALDGIPVPGVLPRLRQLAAHLSLHVLTAGTHGHLAELEKALELPLRLIKDGAEKTRYVRQLDPTRVIAFGNGRNDSGMLSLAAVGVVVLGEEGVALCALQAADILVPGPIAALDLLLSPRRLVATLRE